MRNCFEKGNVVKNQVNGNDPSRDGREDQKVSEPPTNAFKKRVYFFIQRPLVLLSFLRLV